MKPLKFQNPNWSLLGITYVIGDFVSIQIDVTDDFVGIVFCDTDFLES